MRKILIENKNTIAFIVITIIVVLGFTSLLENAKLSQRQNIVISKGHEKLLKIDIESRIKLDCIDARIRRRIVLRDTIINNYYKKENKIIQNFKKDEKKISDADYSDDSIIGYLSRYKYMPTEIEGE